MAGRKICTFVDWENIRISLQQNFLPRVGAKEVAAELMKLVEENGEWRGGFAYADWTKQKDQAHAFEDAGFHAKMVLPKRSGTDRSDMTMSLDILESIVTRGEAIDTVVLATGDSDFQDIIRRAKDKGIYTLVVGVAPTTAAGVISLANQYVAIEARMGLEARSEIEMEHPLPGRDWAQLVGLMAELEEVNRFVGVRRLLNDWMAESPELYGDTLEKRRTYLADAEAEAIVGAYKMRVGGGREASAVRLNREHPVVAAASVSEAGSGPSGDRGPEDVAHP